jgi:hypothetical protein
MTFFRRLEDPNARAWALAIQAAADDDNQVLARSLFDEMDSRSKLDPLCPAPTVYVFSILLAMYLRAGDRASSRAVYDTMIYRDILPTSVTYGIITTSYANSAGESSAEQAHNFAMTVYDITIASEMPHSRGNASENVFGPLLIAAGRAQDMDRVKQYYDLIRSTGCTSFTLTTKLMDAYRRNGQIKPMYRLWLRLFRKALHTVPRLSPGMAPDPMHKTTRSQNNLLCVPLSITMRAFAAAGLHGRIHELWRTVRTSGFGFDASNYNHLAQSLLRTGDIETAFFIVDRVLIPRYDEVRERVNRAQRMTLCLPPVEASPPDAEQEAIGDWDTPELDDALASVPMNLTSEDVAERGPRVSNRRKGFLASPRGTRWAHEEETSGSGSGSGSDSNGPAEPDLDILRYWRPSDILWRPSRATARLLEQVYTSLEDQRAYQAWLGVSIGDDDADLEHEHEHNAEDAIPALTILDPAAARNVNNIQHIAVKHRDGSPVHSTPKALLIRLNRRYARAVALIEFYRLKRKRRAYT